MRSAEISAEVGAWLLGASVAFAAHGLVLAILVASRGPVAASMTPIPIVVELGEAAQLQSEREDVVPGERRDRAVARPIETLRGIEAPLAVDADMTARRRTRPQENAPVADNAAPETTAPSTVESRAASIQIATATYEQILLAHLERHKRYPRVARAHGQEGVTRIRFSIDRRGQVLDVRLVASSGHTLLDREAEALPRRAQPLPSPPAEIAGATIEFTAPIEFFLRR